jgi:hypothetical protein
MSRGFDDPDLPLLAAPTRSNVERYLGAKLRRGGFEQFSVELHERPNCAQITVLVVGTPRVDRSIANGYDVVKLGVCHLVHLAFARAMPQFEPVVRFLDPDKLLA